MSASLGKLLELAVMQNQNGDKEFSKTMDKIVKLWGQLGAMVDVPQPQERWSDMASEEDSEWDADEEEEVAEEEAPTEEVAEEVAEKVAEEEEEVIRRIPTRLPFTQLRDGKQVHGFSLPRYTPIVPDEISQKASDKNVEIRVTRNKKCDSEGWCNIIVDDDEGKALVPYFKEMMLSYNKNVTDIPFKRTKNGKFMHSFPVQNLERIDQGILTEAMDNGLEIWINPNNRATTSSDAKRWCSIVVGGYEKTPDVAHYKALILNQDRVRRH
jgi:hypothetical protein